MLKTKVDIGCTESNNWAYQIKLILDRSGFFKHLATTTNLSIYSKSYKGYWTIIINHGMQTLTTHLN